MFLRSGLRRLVCRGAHCAGFVTVTCVVRVLSVSMCGAVQDLVYPTEIVGKRLRVRVDGTKTLKVHLNPKEKVNVEGKVDTFASVYKNLCKKDVVFEFPVERE